ncbi:endogenous retrovirus group K member 25 Env polyprotein-like [Moschus berezovskii]|uniref:endogenous retrovirus group K member 25 Env polyprotein-like n=1 Tax=Moschus berezovskii TaxID=68408 RepID=UPI0024452DBD|nr:endogenous retrovirus group K member 25 Env polyprotein-like [Moschus berezovskii]
MATLLNLWSADTRRAHSTARASKILSRRSAVPSPPREGARCPRSCPLKDLSKWRPELGPGTRGRFGRSELKGLLRLGMPQSPEYILLAMLSLLACTSAVQALTSHTYWAYIPNPALLQVVEWTERGPIISSNDSMYMPSPWSTKGPSHPEEEGKLINISLGYEVLPLCVGPAELCINVSQETWAFALPPKKDFWTLLGLFTALS